MKRRIRVKEEDWFGGFGGSFGEDVLGGTHSPSNGGKWQT